nr:hypothetical protein [Jannaschia pohangensis]
MSPLPDGRFCVHGTAVVLGQRAVLLLGPTGAGKSGLAAQLIAHGGRLISDDLVVLEPTARGTTCLRPEGAPEAMELRGFGIAATPVVGSAPLALAVLLGASGPRLPEGETWGPEGGKVPFVRHPTTADLAAKILIWMRAE